MGLKVEPAALETIYQSLAILRSSSFTAQKILLPLVERLATGQNKRSLAQFKDDLKMAMPKVEKLIKQDIHNISQGYYPAQVLFEESPWVHFTRVPFLFADAFRAARQKSHKKADVFAPEDIEFLNETPEYFRRNFHFQKGGYLSDESARLYDHQVEVLFSGTAQAMRRQMIPRLKAHFSNSQGEGLRFLDVGSGTGSLTRNLALAFPKAQIVCLDISPHYLKFAQNKLADFKRISYFQGLAENMSFKDESFDAVVSCYLFHELPEKVRLQVMQEMLRVLKKKGMLAIADSLQWDDDADMNWALTQFPQDFHEPFYKNYTQKKIEEALLNHQLKEIMTDIAFLTKIVSGVKSPPP